MRDSTEEGVVDFILPNLSLRAIAWQSQRKVTDRH
jgi:hypothetical protein